MKKNIHPLYKTLKVKIGDDVFETRSTYPGDEVLMDIDFRKHPAWTKKGVGAIDQSNKDISTFNNRFPGLSFGLKK